MSTDFETSSGKPAASSKDPEEIEREIDDTRAELHRILDALEAKLSFRRRVDGVMSSARENGAAFASVAGNAVRQYRTPLVVAGATVIGLLVARQLSRRR
jgi:hypothetical protein